MAIAGLYWVDAPKLHGRLAVAPKPRAGDWLEDEIRSWKAAGIQDVVCLLETDEILETGLSEESMFCRKHEMAFHSFPIPDRGVPADERVARKFMEGIAGRISAGRNVVVHCRAGIGRTGLIASCILISVGIEAASAIAIVSDARKTQVPDTAAQKDWIFNFAG